jgi:hypothetical protein
MIKNNVGEVQNLTDVDNIAFLRKGFVIFLLHRSTGASLQLVPDEATLGLEVLP